MAASDFPRTANNTEYAKPLTVLRFRTGGKYPATAKRHALDGTKKNCYTAVLDGKIELFLSSSPSVIHLQQFFSCCQGWRQAATD